MGHWNHKNDVSAQQNDTHRRLLSALLKQEDNRRCADCLARGPTWASVNLGVFVCLNCSGIHRSLGVHNSKVRSTNLDTWLPEQVAFVQVMGNARANAFWEAELPTGFSRPAEADMGPLRTFITNKYVHRKYALRGYDEPPTISNYASHPFLAQYLAPARSAPPPPPAAAVAAAPAASQQQQPQHAAAAAAAPQATAQASRPDSQPSQAAPAVDLLDLFDAPRAGGERQGLAPTQEQELWSVFHGAEAVSPGGAGAVHVSASAPDIYGGSALPAPGPGPGGAEAPATAPPTGAALRQAEPVHDPFAALEARGSQAWSWGSVEAALPVGEPNSSSQLGTGAARAGSSASTGPAGAMNGGAGARRSGPKLSHENILALFDAPSSSLAPAARTASANGFSSEPGPAAPQLHPGAVAATRGPADFQF